VKINDEDTIITASSDGLLRLVQIHPNALLGVIANHYDGFPVEGVGLSRDFGVMATFSHDSCVRLWDTSILMDGDDDDGEGEEEEETQENVIQDRKEISSGKVKRSSDDEWDDDDDDDDNSDSDSDSDDSDDETRATNAGNKKQRTIKNDNEMFFADL